MVLSNIVEYQKCVYILYQASGMFNAHCDSKRQRWVVKSSLVELLSCGKPAIAATLEGEKML